MAFPLGRNEYITEEPVQMWLGTRESGVFSADGNLMVAEDEGMGIKVLEGLGWIRFAKFRGIMYGNTGTLNFHLSSSDAVLKRIDRVVLQFDAVLNEAKIIVKQGLPSSDPVPQSIEREDNVIWELALADIYIGPGVDAITQANITDLRLDPELCGIMRDGVAGIPSEGLLAQYQSWFENLKQSATGGTEELSEWIYTFKQQSELEFRDWMATNEEWIEEFKDYSEEEFDAWLQALKEITLPEDLAAQFAVEIQALKEKPDVLLSNNFDDYATKKGCVYRIQKEADGSLLETITISDSGDLLAERTTRKTPAGAVEVQVNFYPYEKLEDGYLIVTTPFSQKMVTTKNDDGSIQTEVI